VVDEEKELKWCREYGKKVEEIAVLNEIISSLRTGISNRYNSKFEIGDEVCFSQEGSKIFTTVTGKELNVNRSEEFSFWAYSLDIKVSITGSSQGCQYPVTDICDKVVKEHELSRKESSNG